jgi:hypothetical protein
VYSLPQRVLIISDDALHRETTRLLLGSMGCPWIMASGLEEAIRILRRGSVAAAVLDSRITGWDCEKEHQNVRDVVAYLAGRVILVFGETHDPRAMDLARTHSLPFLKRERWAQELWGILEVLLLQSVLARFVKETARLTLDTFLQPVPAGDRHMPPSVRHLLYETSSIAVDVSIERLPDSNSILLAGQILLKVESQRSLNGARVALLGPKGLLGLGVTNQSGEFLFEFDKEPNVVLEIEDAPNHRVAIHSPNLAGWSGQGDSSRRSKGHAQNSTGAKGTRLSKSPANQRKTACEESPRGCNPNNSRDRIVTSSELRCGVKENHREITRRAAS